MRNLIFALGAMALATGCSKRLDAEPVIIFLEEVGDTEVESDQTCSESFMEADCPTEDGGGTDSPWTYTQEFSGTGSQFYIFIHDNGPKKNLVLIAGGYTYVGTATKGRPGSRNYIIDAERVAENDSLDEETHEDGYTYRTHEVVTETVKWHLEVEKGQLVNSEITTTTEGSVTVEETDEWDQDITYYGQIENDCYYVLDGDCYNYPEDDDCDGNMCSFEIVGTTTTTTPIVWGFEVDQTYHDSLAGAGQSAGEADL